MRRAATAVTVLAVVGVGVVSSMHGTGSPAHKAAGPAGHHTFAAHQEQPAPSPAPTRDASRSQHRRHVSRAPRPRPSQAAPAVLAGVPAKDLPNLSLTPGLAMTVSRRAVCTPGYSSRVRDVPDSESEAVYARYGIPHLPYAHEVDHLVSLELGGSNAITNLWPEPYAGRWGAHTKDVLENRLHDLVCSGSLDLRKAQRQEAANWVAAYRRYVGGTPGRLPASHQTPERATHPAAAGSSGSGCEPGYSPCLPRVSDLDCADIPASKRPVRVTGSDPYRLDADGDGWGCES